MYISSPQVITLSIWAKCLSDMLSEHQVSSGLGIKTHHAI